MCRDKCNKRNRKKIFNIYDEIMKKDDSSQQKVKELKNKMEQIIEENAKEENVEQLDCYLDLKMTLQEGYSMDYINIAMSVVAIIFAVASVFVSVFNGEMNEWLVGIIVAIFFAPLFI